MSIENTSSQPPILPQVDGQSLPTPNDVFGQMMADEREANHLWGDGKEVRVRHGKGEYQALTDVLRSGRARLSQFGDLFNDDGSIRVKEKLEFDYKTISPDELSEIINERMKPVHELVSLSLNAGHKKRGMNRHDFDGHITNVHRRARELALMLSGSEKPQDFEAVEKEIITTSEIHDLGNMLSRGVHAFVSPKIAFARIPELKQYFDVMSRIKKNTIVHDERVTRGYFKLLQIKFGVDTPEYYQAIRQKYGEAALAVLAADKADAANRDRVSNDEDIPNEIRNNDRHTTVAALAESSEYKYETRSGKIDLVERRWNFDPKLPEDSDLLKLFVVFMSGKHVGEIVVPKMRHLHEEHGVPFFFSWFTDLCSLHADRMGIEATALCALSEKLEYVRFVAEDKSMMEKYGFKMRFELEMHRSDITEMTQWLRDEINVRDDQTWSFENMPTVLQSEVKAMQRENISERLKKTSWLERPLHESESKKSHLSVIYEFDTDPNKRIRVSNKVFSLFSPRPWRGQKFWADSIDDDTFDEL